MAAALALSRGCPLNTEGYLMKVVPGSSGGSKNTHCALPRPFSGCSQVAIVAHKKGHWFPWSGGEKDDPQWGWLWQWLMLDMLSLYHDLHWVLHDPWAILTGTIISHWIQTMTWNLSGNLEYHLLAWVVLFFLKNGIIQWQHQKAYNANEILRPFRLIAKWVWI